MTAFDISFSFAKKEKLSIFSFVCVGWFFFGAQLAHKWNDIQQSYWLICQCYWKKLLHFGTFQTNSKYKIERKRHSIFRRKVKKNRRTHNKQTKRNARQFNKILDEVIFGLKNLQQLSFGKPFVKPKSTITSNWHKWGKEW